MKEEFAHIKAVVLDIEGTTTPIEFVHSKLFTFAKEQVGSFLKEKLGDPQIDAILCKIEKSYKDNPSKDKVPNAWSNADTPLLADSAIKYVEWLISVDSKDPALKELQGLIWESGFRNNQLHGEVYPDVPKALEKLFNEGIRIAIYSSGSVLAQKLIFGSTKYGDLTKYISAFFDTGVGNKREPKSYSNISAQLDLLPNDIMFLSDILEEISAARASGFLALQVIREGHSTSKDTIFPTITSLLDLLD